MAFDEANFVKVIDGMEHIMSRYHMQFNPSDYPLSRVLHLQHQLISAYLQEYSCGEPFDILVLHDEHSNSTTAKITHISTNQCTVIDINNWRWED